MFAQGEDEFQSAAFAVAYGDRPAVDHDGVFDDRKPESRAAQLARAPLVDTVEPLEEVREVFFVDADAVVGEKYISAKSLPPQHPPQSRAATLIGQSSRHSPTLERKA